MFYLVAKETGKPTVELLEEEDEEEEEKEEKISNPNRDDNSLSGAIGGQI